MKHTLKVIERRDIAVALTESFKKEMKEADKRHQQSKCYLCSETKTATALCDEHKRKGYVRLATPKEIKEHEAQAQA